MPTLPELIQSFVDNLKSEALNAGVSKEKTNEIIENARSFEAITNKVKKESTQGSNAEAQAKARADALAEAAALQAAKEAAALQAAQDAERIRQENAAIEAIPFHGKLQDVYPIALNLLHVKTRKDPFTSVDSIYAFITSKGELRSQKLAFRDLLTQSEKIKVENDRFKFFLMQRDNISEQSDFPQQQILSVGPTLQAGTMIIPNRLTSHFKGQSSENYQRWKPRLAEMFQKNDHAKVITYGPSGTGKTSFIKELVRDIIREKKGEVRATASCVLIHGFGRNILDLRIQNYDLFDLPTEEEVDSMIPFKIEDTIFDETNPNAKQFVEDATHYYRDIDLTYQESKDKGTSIADNRRTYYFSLFNPVSQPKDFTASLGIVNRVFAGFFEKVFGSVVPAHVKARLDRWCDKNIEKNKSGPSFFQGTDSFNTPDMVFPLEVQAFQRRTKDMVQMECGTLKSPKHPYDNTFYRPLKEKGSGEMMQKVLTTENAIEEALNNAFYRKTKFNPQSSRSLFVCTLTFEGKTLDIIDLFGNEEKFTKCTGQICYNLENESTGITLSLEYIGKVLEAIKKQTYVKGNQELDILIGKDDKACPISLIVTGLDQYRGPEAAGQIENHTKMLQLLQNLDGREKLDLTDPENKAQFLTLFGIKDEGLRPLLDAFQQIKSSVQTGGKTRNRRKKTKNRKKKKTRRL